MEKLVVQTTAGGLVIVRLPGRSAGPVDSGGDQKGNGSVTARQREGVPLFSTTGSAAVAYIIPPDEVAVRLFGADGARTRSGRF